MKLTIIIPVYNEQATIEKLINRIYSLPLEKEIIIVDDGSDKDTKRILNKIQNKNPSIKILNHKNNRGKGASIRTALKYASGDYVIIQDADLEYNPEEYEILLKPLIEGKSDVVYGSRFLGARRVFLFWHHIGNKFLTLITNILYNTNLTDLMTCYKLMPTEYLKMFNLKSDRFEIEAEITAKVFKSKLRVFEIPITYEGRGYEEGKKTRWIDGLKTLLTLIKYRFWVSSIGEETLRRISRMKKFNWWIYNQIESYLGKRVLETGCGTGNLSHFLIHKEFSLGIDIEENYIKKLNEKYNYLDNIKFSRCDLQNLDIEYLKTYLFDSIICINVLEHIEDDEKVLKDFYSILEENGRLIIIVPALQFLYCQLDKNLGHKRRYDKDRLLNLLKISGFKIERASFLNFFGAFGWFFSGHILKRKILPSVQLSLYESFVPVFSLIEKKLGLPLGLSLLVVARKKEK